MLLLVDPKHHHVNFVTDAHQFTWVIDSASPRHFTDVNKPFDPIFQLDEGTVGQHVDHFALDCGIHRILFANVVPRAFAFLLQAQSDLFFFVVDVQDHDFDLVVDLHHFCWVTNTSPAHVGDMQQTVDSAEVNKRTEIGDILDCSFAKIANGEYFQQLLLLFFSSFFDQATTRNNDVFSSFVDLQDLTFDVVTDVICDVLRTTDVHLARRQEDIDAIFDDGFAIHFSSNLNKQAALDLANHWTTDDIAFVVSLDDGFPVAETLGLLHR